MNSKVQGIQLQETNIEVTKNLKRIIKLRIQLDKTECIRN